MPDYLHRTTKEILNSIAAADLPELAENYIVYPDLSAVVTQPRKYWVITGNVITLADQATRDQIDATELAAAKEQRASNLDPVVRALIRSLNDGSFIPGSNYTAQEIKQRIKAKL